MDLLPDTSDTCPRVCEIQRLLHLVGREVGGAESTSVSRRKPTPGLPLVPAPRPLNQLFSQVFTNGCSQPKEMDARLGHPHCFSGTDDLKPQLKRILGNKRKLSVDYG